MSATTGCDIFEELGFDRSRVRLPEGELIYALARTYNLVIRRLSAIYKRFGLSAASFNLLVLLQRGKDPDSFTQQAIGERLVVSPSDMTGLVDRLERKGLVRRQPGTDRRTKLLRITSKGERVVEQVWPKHQEEIRSLIQHFSRGDRESLGRSLASLRHVVGIAA